MTTSTESPLDRARQQIYPTAQQRAAVQFAIGACHLLIELAERVQQHRGMSSAWLSGDAGFEQGMVAKRAEIEPLIGRLHALAAEEACRLHPCFLPDDVRLWQHRWHLLVEELSEATTEKSIATHSNLIALLLTWLGSLGETRIVQSMAISLPGNAVRNFTYRLPQLAETLGQTRATGTAVAAQGKCPAVARVRLMFLVSRAESLTEQANAADRQGDFAAQRVRALASMLRSQLIGSQEVLVSAEEYFAEATRAIDAVYAWVRTCGKQLELALADAAIETQQQPFGGRPEVPRVIE